MRRRGPGIAGPDAARPPPPASARVAGRPPPLTARPAVGSAPATPGLRAELIHAGAGSGGGKGERNRRMFPIKNKGGRGGEGAVRGSDSGAWPWRGHSPGRRVPGLGLRPPRWEWADRWSWGRGFGCEHRSGRIPNRKREGVAKKANKLSGL